MMIRGSCGHAIAAPDRTASEDLKEKVQHQKSSEEVLGLQSTVLNNGDINLILDFHPARNENAMRLIS
jgi:hypothetical protein